VSTSAGDQGTAGAPDAWDPAPFRDRLQDTIEEFLAEQSRRLAPLGADGERLMAQARLIVSGGKRFRAAFCYWGYRAVDADPADEAPLLRACAALEVLHASALVHDDFMDASDTRRGRPSTHRVFTSEHRAAGWSGSPDQYGAAAAILLGDLLLSWADELLRRCGLPAERVSAALDLFDLCRSEVIVGQFLDVSVQARAHADVDTAMTVLRYKSAKYSIERPLHIGAALAGADPSTLARLSAFGLPLGEAFQLRDDLLGVFGDPATTGKPAGDDLVEGKRTVLIALALDAGGAEAGVVDDSDGQGPIPTGDRALLDGSLGTALSPDQIHRLREIIDASGARAQVEQAIEALALRADAALDQLTIDRAAKAALRALAQAATDRSH